MKDLKEQRKRKNTSRKEASVNR